MYLAYADLGLLQLLPVRRINNLRIVNGIVGSIPTPCGLIDPHGDASRRVRGGESLLVCCWQAEAWVPVRRASI